jgi:hypothetical protein
MRAAVSVSVMKRQNELAKIKEWTEWHEYRTWSSSDAIMRGLEVCLRLTRDNTDDDYGGFWQMARAVARNEGLLRPYRSR